MTSFILDTDSDGSGSIDWNEFVRFQGRSQDILDEFWTMDLAELRSEFQMLDINHDGKITRQEFLQVMRKLYHISTSKGLEDFKAIVEKIKIEMSLTDPVSDLTTGYGSDPKERFVRQMMERFRAADVDQNGQITFAEFIRHEWTMNESLNSNSKACNLKSLRREFQQLDLDGNGKVSEQEFKMIIARVYDNMAK
ncbi:hypothetical protein TCAL_07405 [Tigriopus californicus]|uniref:EF-hand domain-containing protein n=1 Tax=Tigriopus californicus TaxID=6832 RepID=A0A553P8S3_TIGCA|nr:hypothetical protein TCAL_07405 [Tigriopus californicus]